MDEGVKKMVMIGIVVVGFPLAGIIFWTTRGSNRNQEIPADEMQLVKCNNPACGASYEVSMREYSTFQREHLNPLASSAAAMTCTKCGKPSVYKAFKCAKCEKVSLYGSVPNDFGDRCPECKFSQMEADRKAAQEARGQ